MGDIVSEIAIREKGINKSLTPCIVPNFDRYQIPNPLGKIGEASHRSYY